MSDSDQREVGIGVIGCGYRISHILELLLPLDARLRLRAVSDPSPDAIAAARRKFAPDLAVHEDYRALVRDPRVDWVFVGSWNCFHAEQVIAALEAGKDVFCEKPLATTAEQCLAVRDAVRRTGRTFAFGLVLRNSPHYIRIKQLVDEGKIGSLISFEFNEALAFHHGWGIFGNWRGRTANAGSHVLEKCCHDLDIANWMAGSLPVRVACFGGRRIFTPENRAWGDRLMASATDERSQAGWRKLREGGDPFTADLLDHQVAILEYANGVRATFHSNVVAGLSERRLYLLGTLGSIRSDAYTKRITYQAVGFGTEPQDLSTSATGPHAGADEPLARHLADTLLRGARPAAGIEEALRSALVAFAIDQAQATGQVVDLRPVWQRAGVDIPAAVTG